MAEHRKRAWFVVGVIVWTFVVYGLSVLPSSSIPSVGIRNIDKIVHFGMFLIYGFLAAGAGYSKKGYVFKFFLTFMCLFAFGVIMELLQGQIPGRSPDFMDVVFNGTGSAVGITNFLVFKRKFFPG